MSVTIRPSTAEMCAMCLSEYLTLRARTTAEGHTRVRIEYALLALGELVADSSVWGDAQPDVAHLAHDGVNDVTGLVHGHLPGGK